MQNPKFDFYKFSEYFQAIVDGLSGEKFSKLVSDTQKSERETLNALLKDILKEQYSEFLERAKYDPNSNAYYIESLLSDLATGVPTKLFFFLNPVGLRNRYVVVSLIFYFKGSPITFSATIFEPEEFLDVVDGLYHRAHRVFTTEFPEVYMYSDGWVEEIQYLVSVLGYTIIGTTKETIILQKKNTSR